MLIPKSYLRSSSTYSFEAYCTPWFIRNGFVYLAAILDAYSRRVIGYAISAGLETSLTLKALRMAIAARHPAPGVIHHSASGAAPSCD